jgi:hypothetical protein
LRASQPIARAGACTCSIKLTGRVASANSESGSFFFLQISCSAPHRLRPHPPPALVPRRSQPIGTHIADSVPHRTWGPGMILRAAEGARWLIAPNDLLPKRHQWTHAAPPLSTSLNMMHISTDRGMRISKQSCSVRDGHQGSPGHNAAPWQSCHMGGNGPETAPWITPRPQKVLPGDEAHPARSP